jgi:lysophospholipase L1-like esterase
MARLKAALVAAALLAAGAALAPAGSAQAPRIGTGTVLVIGDSLGVGTEPYLRQELPGTPILDDSLGGRPSPGGLDALRADISSSDAVIVFAMGTNDNPAYPEIMAGNLESVAQIAGDRCIVVPTIARPPVSGVSDAGINRVINSFAASHFNVEVVDWKAAVRAQPGLLVDGIHATPEGYALRASLIAQAVDTCLISLAEPDGGGGKDGPPPEDLSEGRTRPKDLPSASEREPQPRPVSTDRAYEILADAVSSHIAIGALD